LVPGPWSILAIGRTSSGTKDKVGLLFRGVQRIRNLPEGKRQFLTQVEGLQDDSIRPQFPLRLK